MSETTTAPAEDDEGRVRLSGMTPGEEAAEAAGDELAQPLDPEVLPGERDKDFEPAYQRMRFDWRVEDHAVVERILSVVEHRVRAMFPDAYEVMFDILDAVRTQMPPDPETQEVPTDEFGWPLWVRMEGGAYLEDWSRLPTVRREALLLRVTTHLFEWERQQADQWGLALFAKAIWKQEFASSFDAVTKGTDATKTQRATHLSVEDHYFAILQAHLSRRADALVRSMDRLALRLRDTLS